MYFAALLRIIYDDMNANNAQYYKFCIVNCNMNKCVDISLSNGGSIGDDDQPSWWWMLSMSIVYRWQLRLVERDRTDEMESLLECGEFSNCYAINYLFEHLNSLKIFAYFLSLSIPMIVLSEFRSILYYVVFSFWFIPFIQSLSFQWLIVTSVINLPIPPSHHRNKASSCLLTHVMRINVLFWFSIILLENSSHCIRHIKLSLVS